MTARIGFAQFRSGAVVNVLLAAVTLATVALGASVSVKRRRDPPPPPPMTSGELEVTLRAGQITPEALAAMGVTANATTALVDRARDHLAPTVEGFRTAQTQFAAARGSVDTLARSVQSGLGGEQAAQLLVEARSTLATRTTSRDSVLDGIKAAALSDSLSQGQAAALTTITANKDWHLPVQYRCRSGVSEAQWVALRGAYLDKRSAERAGGTAAPESLQLLAEWDADPAVSAAKINLEALLPAVTTAWNAAIRGNP